MAMFQIPKPLKPRGIRFSMPSGFLLGRVSPGQGDAELIPVAQLSMEQIKSGVIAPGPIAGGNAGRPHAGIFVPGPIAPSMYYEFAIAMRDAMSFPDTATPSVAKCETAPHATCTFYVVNDLAAFTASSYPAGVIATVTFLASATTGTVTWETGPFTINRGDILRLVTSAATTDQYIQGIQILLSGV